MYATLDTLMYATLDTCALMYATLDTCVDLSGAEMPIQV